MQISNVRNDATQSSSEVGALNIKTQPTVIASANAGEIVDQSGQQATVRGAPPEATETIIFSKNKTERLIRAETDARATNDTSRVRPEPIVASPPVTPLVVFLSFSLGLPAISVSPG
jgi:hypothetical protein